MNEWMNDIQNTAGDVAETRWLLYTHVDCLVADLFVRLFDGR